MTDHAGTEPGPPRSRRARLSRWILRRARLRLVGTLPERGIVVGAPHTSNWDFVLSVLLFRALDARPRVLVKAEAFRWPLGGLLRRLGALETDRSGGTGLVERLTAEAGQQAGFLLALAPDGTRTRTDHWKSGFYRLALSTGLPVTLAFVDGPTRTLGAGPTLEMTGDVAVDMAAIREFYADKQGLRPGRGSTVRLREEGPA